VLAERDRLRIVVGRNVPDGENRHCGYTRMHPTVQFLRQKPCASVPSYCMQSVPLPLLGRVDEESNKSGLGLL
jgi:hypothetical protein